jgi:dehydrogenase/reductase SDR family protein 7B
MKINSNDTAWVTGASSGIGAAMATLLADKVGRLVISARRVGKLQTLKQKCLAKNPNLEVFIHSFDLSDAQSVEQASKDIFDLVSKVDLLINNGGISQRSLVAETDLAVDRRIMEINFFGAVALSKTVLPGMIEQNRGHILTVSSLVGKFGTPLRSAYAASKHALHGWFDSLRAEVYKNQIGVTLFCPGYIRTNISLNALKGDGEKHAQMDDNQQNGKSPESCAEAMLSAIENNKEEVYFGGKEVMGVYVKRFFPGIFSCIIRKMKVKRQR